MDALSPESEQLLLEITNSPLAVAYEGFEASQRDFLLASREYAERPGKRSHTTALELGEHYLLTLSEVLKETLTDNIADPEERLTLAVHTAIEADQERSKHFTDLTGGRYKGQIPTTKDKERILEELRTHWNHGLNPEEVLARLGILLTTTYTNNWKAFIDGVQEKTMAQSGKRIRKAAIYSAGLAIGGYLLFKNKSFKN